MADNDEIEKLELIPDPNSVRVWENMRRIMEWAAQFETKGTAKDQFLTMGS